MLLLLSLSAYRKQVASSRTKVTLLDLPEHVRTTHGLQGLVVPTDLLAGADANALERFRTAADKAACPCLVLEEISGLRLASRDDSVAHGAVDRLDRVLLAAQRMGCSSVGFAIEANETDPNFDSAVERLKGAATRAERLEINLLIRPNKGLTEEPDRVTDIIKRVGGFRLGVMPDFEQAAASADPEGYLRRLAPYAPIVLAATKDFDGAGAHADYDLAPMCESLKSIGFDAGLAIDYRGSEDPDEGVAKSKAYLEPTMLGETA